MLDEDDYDSESDLDYVPSEPEAVSDEYNSGEEDDLQGPKDVEEYKGKRKKSKEQELKKTKDLSARKRQGGIKLDDGEEDNDEGQNEDVSAQQQLEEEIKQEVTVKQEEKQKKRADDLWSSFLSDVGTTPKRTSTSGSPSLSSLSSLSKPMTPVTPKTVPVPSSQKVTVTKTYDFAGETIKVTKEVDPTSKEAKEEQKHGVGDSPGTGVASPTLGKPSLLTGTPGGIKRPSGGLGSVLDKLNKKQKISTLEKSKLDWDSFKEKEGIEDELQIHNRGKGSYLERMAFLQRTDHRQFEIERNLRQGASGKR